MQPELSGVKTPEENADFTSFLKARPTKLQCFSAACSAVAQSLQDQISFSR
jgi:hypothetical protein